MFMDLLEPSGMLTEQQHDAAQVRQRFDEHICNQHIPLKKFNWG